MQSAVGVGVKNLFGFSQTVTGLKLLKHVVAAQGVLEATVADEKTRMTEGNGGSQEAVNRGIHPLGSLPQAVVFTVEHGDVSHPEVARGQRMHLAQIKIDQPRLGGQIIAAILGVVAVRQTGVHPVHVALGVDGAVPGLLLRHHDLAVGVVDCGKSARARHSVIIVDPGPG